MRFGLFNRSPPIGKYAEMGKRKKRFPSPRGERDGMETQWCDNGQAHGGPFFTIIGVALEIGPGTRQKNRKRIQARKTLGRLCAECLRRTVFRMEGSDFYTPESRDLANG